MPPMKRAEYEEALAILLSHTCAKAASHAVPLLDALGEVCAKDVFSRMDQPPFDRSPLDGYALLSSDTGDASKDRPCALKVAGTVLTGDCAEYTAAPGQAFRITTGARIPFGADCVIRQEDVEATADEVKIFHSLARHENYCFRGEDVPRGVPILLAGDRIGAAHIGILAAQGYQRVQAVDRPVIGLFATGSELVDLGAKLGCARIYDSNSYLLFARLKALGADVRRLPPRPDALLPLVEAVESLFQECDAVITTGGVSVGMTDLMPRVASELGGELLFHRVNLKPGTPLLAMERGGKLLLSLSGNPFAAMSTFELFAVPMVKKLSGLRAFDLEREKAVLKDDYQRKGAIRLFIRAALEGGRVSIPKGNHSPGALLAAAGCNCLIDVPASVSALHAGDTVDVIRLGAAV